MTHPVSLHPLARLASQRFNIPLEDLKMEHIYILKCERFYEMYRTSPDDLRAVLERAATLSEATNWEVLNKSMRQAMGGLTEAFRQMGDTFRLNFPDIGYRGLRNAGLPSRPPQGQWRDILPTRNNQRR